MLLLLLAMLHVTDPPTAPLPENLSFSTTGTAPKRVRGSLHDADFPPGLISAVAPARSLIRYTVSLDGRAHNCRAIEQERAPQLGQILCELIVKRFRFRPARDAQGREIEADLVESHEWLLSRQRR